MNKTRLLANLIQEFIFEMCANTVRVRTKEFVTKAGAYKIDILIDYTVRHYGREYEHHFDYAIYQDDLECDFAYTLSAVLNFICDEITDYWTKEYLEFKHDKGVI